MIAKIKQRRHYDYKKCNQYVITITRYVIPQ